MGTRSLSTRVAEAGCGVGLALLLGLVGCTGDTVPRVEPDGAASCGPATCQGCCQGSTCLPGNGDDVCGTGGNLCFDCTNGDGVCDPTLKRCVPSSCTPNCDGQCAGADDGCGGKCAVGDCAGCCQGGMCLDGAADDACGKDGAECSDCSSQQGSCAAGSCSNCTPSCDGKCAGASDGCGGTCSSSGCAGCCEGMTCQTGTAQTACGKGGGACVSCGSEPCQDGTCASCTPSCTGKCKSASDGCGGTCPSNDCSGCCDVTTAECNLGTTDLICGKDGDRCWVCPKDFDGYSWKCVSQTCVHDAPTASFCQGKADGTACTSGTLAGKCRNDACCTGCWSSATGTCISFASSYTNKTCGKGGALCVDCTVTNTTCSSTLRTCTPNVFKTTILGVVKSFKDQTRAAYYLRPYAFPASIQITGGIIGGESFNVSFAAKAPGTYTCSAKNARLSYNAGNGEQYQAGPAVPGTTCSVVVTQVGSVGQRVKGTFTGVMWPTSSTGYATLAASNGSFDVARSADVP